MKNIRNCTFIYDIQTSLECELLGVISTSKDDLFAVRSCEYPYNIYLQTEDQLIPNDGEDKQKRGGGRL